MQIGIIGGTGAQGRALASRLAAAGVEVLLGSRSIERALEAAERIREAGAKVPPDPATNEVVVERSRLIFVAAPFAGAAETVQSHAFAPGTVLVDVTVPLRFVGGVAVLDDVAEGSAAEHLRARLPAHVGLAATLKTIPASILGRPEIPLDCDEFLCGDSPAARAAAAEALARIPGLRLIECGGLEAARALERMTWLAIAINKRYRVRSTRFRVIGV